MSSTGSLDRVIIDVLSGSLVEAGACHVEQKRLRQLLDEDYRFVRADSPEFDPSVLDALGLSPSFVRVIAGGQQAYADHLMPLLDGGKTHAPAHITPRIKEALRSLREVAKPLLCPFTGDLATTNVSLGREWFLYRRDEQMCIVGQLSQPMVYLNTDLIWIFPIRRHVVWIANGFDENYLKAQISGLLARCLAHSAALAVYLGSADRRAGLVDFPCPHLAHNLWNVMSGWDGAIRGDAGGAKPACILEYAGQDFYGSIADLYPDWLEGVAAFRCADDEAILTKQLDENLLLATVKGDFLALELVERIVSKAKAEVSEDFRRELQAFVTSCWPKMLITIRLDNRAWVEQVEGYAALVNALRAKLPRLGVVVDGLSSDSIKGWTTGWMSLKDELDVAEEIEALLDPSIPVFRSVGRLFRESIVISESVDFFVAPSGSGMTIYKWLTNKPGVAFSNSSVMNKASPHRWPLTVWDRFRAGVIPALYISAEDVRDVPSKRDHISRFNFSLNWSVLFDKCLILVDSLNRPET